MLTVKFMHIRQETMSVVDPSKLCILLFILFCTLPRLVSVQAWNFERALHVGKANASRRQFISSIPASLIFSWPIPVLARNMPLSNGADTSKSGTVTALLPIVKLRSDLDSLLQTLKKEYKNHDGGTSITKTKTAISFSNCEIPTQEKAFKRTFDAYSDQVSYKQKFLDQNAFLVYYTNGYDGPGRDSLEKDPVNERQTLQFGARNEAWISWDNFLAEWEYYSSSSGRKSGSDDIEDSFSEMVKYLSNTIKAVDGYMRLSPPQDLEAAQQEKSR